MSTPQPAIKLSTDAPLVLLPIRIETSFQTESKLLNIRIYPDDIHINTHVPELLQDEIQWGNKYVGAQSEADRKMTWHQLAARFGPQRAAWIIRSPEAKPPEQTSKRTSSWTRAPQTSVLPDKWIAIGYVKSGDAYQQVFQQEGKKIADSLVTGPTPGKDALSSTDPMYWMTDFNMAVEVGMALKIPLTDNFKNGLDRLIVFGVKSAVSTNESTSLKTASGTRLRATLEAQRYTRGMSFVPQGTPTNNTTEGPSGYASTDPGYEISYRTECGARRCSSGDGTNGSVLAKALGLDTALFEHVRFAGEVKPLNPQFSDDTPDAGREQVDARHMNTALWSGTWGYYFSQLMADAFQNVDDTATRVRRHFIDYVRARGPLPALRIGPQPYSLLPVTSLDRWKIPSGEAREIDLMAALLADLRKLWSSSVAAVPRVGSQDSSSPKERLLEALSLEATSTSYAVRNAFGSQLVTYYWNFMQRYCGPQWWSKQEDMARSVFASLTRFQETLGGTYLADHHPRLVNFVSGGGAFDLDTPLADIVPASGNARLSRNYIEWLRTSGYQQVRKRNGFFESAPIPLLYLLLRYATLREYAAAAFRLSPPAADSERYEPELININPEESQRTLTVWDQLEKVAGDKNPVGVDLDQLLRAASSVTDPNLPQFVEFRESLRWLKDRPARVLEPLVSETIDLCSHRLDAWITSLATLRLDKLAKEGGGLYLGGYGWVEDLRPAGTSSVKSDAGFIHAPSLTHGAAAAMLYSAHLSHGALEGNSSFAVNLSSQRTRQALRLLEGIRQGQTLGALLGYRFERGLHDCKLDKYIPHYRQLAPLSTDPDPNATPSGTVESIAANNVADGLKLISLWQQGEIPSDQAPKGSPDFNNINAQLVAIDALVDALGDLLVAESAYQTARGNTARASAVLDALGRGDTPPPEIEVVRTPRTGTGITHRVFIPFSGALANPTGWPFFDDVHVRAEAERNLNSWVGSLLGDPSRFVCQYQYVDPISGASLAEPATLTFTALTLSPLDLLYMTQGSTEALQSELEQRLTYYLMLPEQRKGISADAGVRLTFSRGAWATNLVTFAELLETVAAIRRVVVSARALEPRDLTWPANTSLDLLDFAELQQRAHDALTNLDIAVDRLAGSLAALNGALSPSAPKPVDEHYLYDVRSALLLLGYFGFPGVVPAPPSSDIARDSKLLQAQGGTVLALAERRSQDAKAIIDAVQENPSPSKEEQWAAYRETLRVIFGADFQVLPRFNVAASPGLQDSFKNSLASQGGDPFAGLALFQRIAHVRDAAARLDTALIYANALKLQPTLGFMVGQLPFDPADLNQPCWVGLSKDKIPGGRLSLLALVDNPFASSEDPIDLADLSGLHVDEWVEVVPNASETTGIAFQYNEPSARPPQAILLAVAPPGQPEWDLITLAATVMETLDLAKVRMVDPDIVSGVGQFLPALFFAVNQAGDAVSVDFRRVARKRKRRKG